MAYSVVKAGVLQLSRDLGVHLGRRGVRVNALILGPIETPQLRALFEGIGDDEIARRFVHYPIGRFGTPEEHGDLGTRTGSRALMPARLRCGKAARGRRG
jgi:NAD(P)-dependent dehydrogenase (short-subunit alcohol dehydrogenase family)